MEIRIIGEIPPEIVVILKLGIILFALLVVVVVLNLDPASSSGYSCVKVCPV